MSPDMTDMQKYAVIARAINRPFVPRVGQTLVNFRVEESKVTVVMTVHKYTSTDREIRFTARGTRIMAWVRYSNGTTGEYQEVTMWDDEFESYTERLYGRTETIKERTERREWEAMQYRVGSDSSPMDSAYRSTLGYAPMMDYWMKK